MKRYECVTETGHTGIGGPYSYAAMVSDDDGEWVEFAEAEREIAELRAVAEDAELAHARADVATATITSLNGSVDALREEVAILRAVVDALPRCSRCNVRRATRQGYASAFRCEECCESYDCKLPYAETLRALEKL
jgi:hypothetical protein